MGKMEDRMMKGLKQLMPQQAQEDLKKKPKPVRKAAGGMMKKKGYKMGGMMKKGYRKGGPVPKGKKSSLMDAIAKVDKEQKPKTDRQLMQMKSGGMAKKGYAMGGAMKKKGMKKGGKVRGAGIVSKGVRSAKMVTMKGS